MHTIALIEHAYPRISATNLYVRFAVIAAILLPAARVKQDTTLQLTALVLLAANFA